MLVVIVFLQTEDGSEGSPGRRCSYIVGQMWRRPPSWSFFGHCRFLRSLSVSERGRGDVGTLRCFILLYSSNDRNTAILRMNDPEYIPTGAECQHRCRFRGPITNEARQGKANNSLPKKIQSSLTSARKRDI